MTDEFNWYLDAYLSLSSCRDDPNKPISIQDIKAYIDTEGSPARLKHVIEMIQALDRETKSFFAEDKNEKLNG